MKRLLFMSLAVMLILSLTCNVVAAGDGVTVSDANGGPGQTVYLTVQLQNPVEASAIGIQCQFDETLLDAVPELSTWEKEGLLSSFDSGNKGVWASQSSAKLEGKLCVLVFQIKDGVAFDSTEVICTVVLKDGATEKLNAVVKGVIHCQCTHIYGAWVSTGSTYHTRECELCGGKNTQTHTWDSGVKEEQPNGQIILVKTCTLCKARHGEDVTDTEQGSAGIPGTNTNSQEGHNHSAVVTSPAEHDHNHSEDILDEHNHTESANDPATIWIVLLLPVALIVVGIWFLKKK